MKTELSFDIDTYIQKKCLLIEKKLDLLLPENNEAQKTLYQAARYSLLNGGKRLRPILALATVEALGGTSDKALSAACAIEMIHTYSLIHDDLPCMDDDDFRRGKPSLHKAYGEAQAVLAGDYLLTYAFEVISKDADLRLDQKISLISLLSTKAGGQGMVGGQILDIEAEGKEIDIHSLQHLHRLKTGALITASIEFGGIIADASTDQMEILCQAGDNLGLAFQIIDDVIDVTSSEKKHGKQAASDIINHKTTYVSLLGLEPAKQSAYSLYHSAVQQLDKLNSDSIILQELAKRLVYRDL